MVLNVLIVLQNRMTPNVGNTKLDSPPSVIIMFMRVVD